MMGNENACILADLPLFLLGLTILFSLGAISPRNSNSDPFLKRDRAPVADDDGG